MSTAAAPGTLFPDGGKGRLRRGTAEERAAAAGRTGEDPRDCHRIVEHYGRKTTSEPDTAGAGSRRVFDAVLRGAAFFCGRGRVRRQKIHVLRSFL